MLDMWEFEGNVGCSCVAVGAGLLGVIIHFAPDS